MAVASFKMSGIKELMKAVQGIQKGKRKVITRALNKTARGAKTDAVKLIRQHLMIKAKPVRENVRISKATWSKPTAYLFARGKRGVPLLGNYPVRPGRLGARKPKQGVSVQIKRFGGRKVIKGSFLAKMKSGHVGVFLRDSADRLPIKQLHGMGFIQLLERGMIHRRLKKSIAKRMERNLKHEINHLLQSNLKRTERLKK